MAVGKQDAAVYHMRYMRCHGIEGRRIIGPERASVEPGLRSNHVEKSVEALFELFGYEGPGHRASCTAYIALAAVDISILAEIREHAPHAARRIGEHIVRHCGYAAPERFAAVFVYFVWNEEFRAWHAVCREHHIWRAATWNERYEMFAPPFA